MLAQEMQDVIGQVAQEIPLSGAVDAASALLRGEIEGRAVVDVAA